MSQSVSSETAAGEFLPGLHALRGLAALWILLFHLVFLLPLEGEDGPLLRLLRRGPLGVDLFFVMSGYIIARRYAGAQGWSLPRYRHFLLRRLARIYPLHLLMLLCTLGFLALLRSRGQAPPELLALDPPGEVLRHLLLVQSWGRFGHTLNVPAWSISVEWLLYLLVPLLGWPFRQGGRALALLCLLLLCLARLLWGTDYDALGRPVPENWMPLIHGGTGFGCGLAIERLLRDGAPAWVVVLGWASGLALPVLLLLSTSDWLVFLLFLPLTAAASLRPLPGCPERLARWAGDLSYPLYMVHGLTVLALGGVLLHKVPALGSGFALVGLAVGLGLVSLLLAWRVHLRIERPARRWILRRLDRAPAGA